MARAPEPEDAEDGRRVLVHCFAGQSRTGLVLRAWMRRDQAGHVLASGHLTAGRAGAPV